KSQLTDRHAPMLARIRQLAAQDPSWRSGAEALVRSLPLYVKVTSAVRSIEAWERAFTFAFLSRHFRCATFGAGGPALDAWGVRATHLGSIRWEDQAEAYSRGSIGLNVMRWQDDMGLNMKPYEITASGAVCLCARRAGL